jgi:PKD repeat protein
VSLTWDNGTVGNAAAYTWTRLGTYPVAVTASNPCGQAYAALTVTVFCQPLTGLAVDGPLATLVGQETTYQAVPQPLTASLPLTYTWDNGRSGRTTSYSWTQPGTYTLSVTATNVCGGAPGAAFTVRVLAEWPYWLYLPLYYRHL